MSDARTFCSHLIKCIGCNKYYCSDDEIINCQICNNKVLCYNCIGGMTILHFNMICKNCFTKDMNLIEYKCNTCNRYRRFNMKKDEKSICLSCFKKSII